MGNSIEWYITQLRNINSEIRIIEKNIQNKRNDFERQIEELIDNLRRKKEELCILTDKLIPIRLGDLLYELAILFGINISNIYVEIETGISFYGKHNMLEILELIDNKDMGKCKTYNNEMKIELFGYNEDYLVTFKPVFEYYTSLFFDLNEKNFVRTL